VKVIKNNDKSIKRGVEKLFYGFVNFLTQAGQQKALATCQGAHIRGQLIRLKEQMPTDTRSTFEVDRSLFIGNIPRNLTETSFRAELEKIHGSIESTRLKNGFGFVSYTSSEEAQKAFRKLMGHTIMNKKINVEFTEGPKTMTPAEHGLQQEVKTLHLSGLTAAVKDCHIRSYFRQFGALVRVYIPKVPTGCYNRFAFVEFTRAAHARRAVEKSCNLELQNARIRVSMSTRRPSGERRDQLRPHHPAHRARHVDAPHHPLPLTNGVPQQPLPPLIPLAANPTHLGHMNAHNQPPPPPPPVAPAVIPPAGAHGTSLTGGIDQTQLLALLTAAYRAGHQQATASMQPQTTNESLIQSLTKILQPKPAVQPAYYGLHGTPGAHPHDYPAATPATLAELITSSAAHVTAHAAIHGHSPHHGPAVPGSHLPVAPTHPGSHPAVPGAHPPTYPPPPPSHAAAMAHRALPPPANHTNPNVRQPPAYGPARGMAPHPHDARTPYDPAQASIRAYDPAKAQTGHLARRQWPVAQNHYEAEKQRQNAAKPPQYPAYDYGPSVQNARTPNRRPPHRDARSYQPSGKKFHRPPASWEGHEARKWSKNGPKRKR